MEIKALLEQTSLPVAYRFYRCPPPLPYLVYYFDSETAIGADYKNLAKQKTVTVELYTDKKDLAVEQQIESVLDGFQFNKSEEYLDTEEMYQIIYEFDIFEEI